MLRKSKEKNKPSKKGNLHFAPDVVLQFVTGSCVVDSVVIEVKLVDDE